MLCVASPEALLSLINAPIPEPGIRSEQGNRFLRRKKGRRAAIRKLSHMNRCNGSSLRLSVCVTGLPVVCVCMPASRDLVISVGELGPRRSHRRNQRHHSAKVQSQQQLAWERSLLWSVFPQTGHLLRRKTPRMLIFDISSFFRVEMFGKKFESVCYGLMSSAANLLPTLIQKGDTSFTISLLSNVLPFTMWFNASQRT